MPSKRQVAQFLWVGTRLSRLETLCLQSFLDVGYDVHLYTYNPLDGIPDGVTICDANGIIPEAEVFLGPGARGGSYASFADRFRYHLLYLKGGWWFDTDHIAVRVRPEPTDLLIASQWQGKDGQYATNSALWARPGDPRVKWLMDRCDELLSEGGELPYTRLGPMLVNELVTHFGIEKNLAPWWEFNPYPFYYINRIVYFSNRDWLFDVARIVLHRYRQIVRKHFRAAYVRPGTRAIHLFNEIWSDQGLDKNADYHPRSVYGHAQRKYGARPG